MLFAPGIVLQRSSNHTSTEVLKPSMTSNKNIENILTLSDVAQKPVTSATLIAEYSELLSKHVGHCALGAQCRTAYSNFMLWICNVFIICFSYPPGRAHTKFGS